MAFTKAALPTVGFSSTRHKIAVFFSVLSSLFLVTSTLVAIFLLRWEITRQAQVTLEQALTSVQADYQADRLNSKVSTLFQFDTSQSPSFYRSRQLPNVSDQATLAPDSKEVNEALTESANQVQPFSGETMVVATLEKNRHVYSRVVAGNGDILFTSDLFTSFNIDPTQNGFFTIENTDHCFHVMTSRPDSQGTVIQVGQYCAFSLTQQVMIFLEMLVVTAIAVVATYLAGWLIAGRLLQPLETAVYQTRQFAENCYHELLTPISVAMSSVSAALKSKNYRAGLESVDEDLRDVHQTLQTLSQHALQAQADTKFEKINFSYIVTACVQKYHPEAQARQLHFNLTGVQKNIFLTADKGSCQIMVENVIKNAVKYAEPATEVIVDLTEQGFSAKNKIGTTVALNPTHFFERGYRGSNSKNIAGHGLGLAIVKELAEAHGWRVLAKAHQNEVRLDIHFKKDT